VYNEMRHQAFAFAPGPPVSLGCLIRVPKTSLLECCAVFSILIHEFIFLVVKRCDWTRPLVGGLSRLCHCRTTRMPHRSIALWDEK